MIQLNDIKKVGSKTIKLLNKLDIYSVNDLLEYYPFRYDLIRRSNINELKNNDPVIIDGVIENVPIINRYGKRKDRMTFRINTNTKILNISIFNRGFMHHNLVPGKVVTIIGKYDILHNTIVASDIRFGEIGEDHIEGVYHTTSGISSKQIKSFVDEALKMDIQVEDYIPSIYQERYHFCDKKTAIKNIHNPKLPIDLKKARLRMKYEELFVFMLKINMLKHNKSNKLGLSREVDVDKVKDFIAGLPFELTKDQLKCSKEIYLDLISEKRMNRLVQGDVGSGKTVVSIISMYINYLSGYQSALMAPTEILAIQHYHNLLNMFKDYDIKIELLTGKLKNKERKQVLEDLKEGNIDIIVGTHALISEDVEYNNLGLVITDEQHRFGVNQRANLRNKGITPDILYMSATPIPRTYALTLYGDMDVSNIRTMPNGRKPIITILRRSNEIKDVLERMYKELKNNHQIYVVAPLIEESLESSLENVKSLEEKMNKAFGKKYKVGVLHGKQDNDTKDKIMNNFKDNKIQILISTTVIEVGVDVANATMMVIFDAYRFGLSSIHQLRGRVGRNSLQSYCILISDKDAERLNVLVSTNDGFKVSEEDFKLRGSGDLFGIRQSGDMQFKVADLRNDFNILLKAKDDSLEYLRSIDYAKDLKIVNLMTNSSNLD
jgi:ATP-dependent DNA helicase RecG